MQINDRSISLESPTYFIADIAANHDGDMKRAEDLIYLAAESGADAAKFQHFRASMIVSDSGFGLLGGKVSHQSSWKKSVYEVYNEASINIEWTHFLYETCKKAGIDFFSSPYDFDMVDHLDEFVPAYKIGSGDITWLEIIEKIAKKNKPVILATGASSLGDVIRAVDVLESNNENYALLQCNTNYTGRHSNFSHISLNVLKTFAALYPKIPLGLSDHTAGDVTVLGAVALGARVIEKHFTDDNSREGPDHHFAMNPSSWRDMVDRVRTLEESLGSTLKKVEENERESIVIQRRALYAACPIRSGDVIVREMLSPLRPCPETIGIEPYYISRLIGMKVRRDLASGELLEWKDLM